MKFDKETDLNPDYFASLSDIELLNFAASAIDKVYHERISIDGYFFQRCVTDADDITFLQEPESFNPLESNESALELSYKLRLDIQYDEWFEGPKCGAEILAHNYSYEIPDGDEMLTMIPWSYGRFTGNAREDMSSLRRAIVRTAAWVGALKLQKELTS